MTKKYIFIPITHREEGYINFVLFEFVCKRQMEAWQTQKTTHILNQQSM